MNTKRNTYIYSGRNMEPAIQRKFELKMEEFTSSKKTASQWRVLLNAFDEKTNTFRDHMNIFKKGGVIVHYIVEIKARQKTVEAKTGVFCNGLEFSDIVRVRYVGKEMFTVDKPKKFKA